MAPNFGRFNDSMVNKTSNEEIGRSETIISGNEAALSTNTNFLTKLQHKWGVESLFQVFLILLAFSLAGSSVVFFRKLLFNLLGYNSLTPFWLKTVTYIIFIFPTYQVLILLYGTLLGQFNFFWEKEKKLGRAIKKMFTRR